MVAEEQRPEIRSDTAPPISVGSILGFDRWDLYKMRFSLCRARNGSSNWLASEAWSRSRSISGPAIDFL